MGNPFNRFQSKLIRWQPNKWMRFIKIGFTNLIHFTCTHILLFESNLYVRWVKWQCKHLGNSVLLHSTVTAANNEPEFCHCYSRYKSNDDWVELLGPRIIDSQIESLWFNYGIRTNINQSIIDQPINFSNRMLVGNARWTHVNEVWIHHIERIAYHYGRYKSV